MRNVKFDKKIYLNLLYFRVAMFRVWVLKMTIKLVSWHIDANLKACYHKLDASQNQTH